MKKFLKSFDWVNLLRIVFEKIYDSFYNIEKIGKEEAINEDS